jgi:tRNA threonylcarbamoyladenosine biosynthesis protein TsaE
MEELFVSTSVKETQGIAARLVMEMEEGTTLCLYGDLASGKTTFTQGLALPLGINRLTSPTFIVMREYPVSSHPVIKRLYHLDLYRIDSPEEIRAFDLEEITSDKSNLVVIEWSERISSILPSKRLEIHLKETDDNEREIKIFNHR